ncbi:3-phosphoshikimate 1-carboxyvinyltransferase [Sphaerisporangium rubeum]|nr:3-phosphoshikimate 1-carboxyvinyltransferase [Sphaerisporangium rubeum]
MDALQYNQIHVAPANRLAGAITPPASKSSSARAVLAAALAPGRSHVVNVATSNNVRAMMDCCRALGAEITDTGTGVEIVGPEELTAGTTLCPGNSGIVLRLLMGATALTRDVTFITPYVESLGRRSNSEMVGALRELGVLCTSTGPDDRLPITLDGSATHGGHVAISGRRSSQFLSGLLYLGGLLGEELTVTVKDQLKARPMVRTTLDVLRNAGVDVRASDDLMEFHVDGRQRFQPARHVVGSDPASTAALLALAASVESEIRLENCVLEELGGVLDYLREIGVDLVQDGTTLTVRGGGPLKPMDFDGSIAPDAVLPLAALAAHADGTSRFYNIEHLRYKECDRISDFRHELRTAGVDADERRDELIVHGSSEGVRGGVVVDSHYDHGVVFAMTLVALRSEDGLTIRNPQYAGQTYPKFFDDLGRLGVTVTV